MEKRRKKEWSNLIMDDYKKGICHYVLIYLFIKITNIITSFMHSHLHISDKADINFLCCYLDLKSMEAIDAGYDMLDQKDSQTKDTQSHSSRSFRLKQTCS